MFHFTTSETIHNYYLETWYLRKNDVTYFGKSPEQNCTHNYLGNSARRILERIIDHGVRDQNLIFLDMP